LSILLYSEFLALLFNEPRQLYGDEEIPDYLDITLDYDVFLFKILEMFVNNLRFSVYILFCFS